MTDRKIVPLERIPTGVPNFDALLFGGLPKESVTVIGGSPGTGKTTLCQQIAFHNATPERPALFFQTLSEPTVKTLRYLTQFNFFDKDKLDKSVHFVDLGGLLRTKGLQSACDMMMEHVKRIQPGVVVIDSFKAFSDLSDSNENLRKFSYEIIINLLVWECAIFLIGEFTDDDIKHNPMFSIVDGLIILSALESTGEQQRFLQILKMRGTDHNRDKHPIVISSDGIEIFAPSVTIRRNLGAETEAVQSSFRQTGIATLDALLDKGIRPGFSVLVSGATGTGKTLLALETIYRGATQFKEKGIFFSFEETEQSLIFEATAVGMDFQSEIKRGMIEIISVPQPDILVEKHLQMMQQRIEKLGAKRIVINSLSSFLHKVKDPQIIREKLYQLSTLVQRTQGLGFFISDVMNDSQKLSHFGIEETVLDGVILLSSIEEGRERQRYLEIYKLRNTAHSKGRHKMTIDSKGIQIQRHIE